jgi:DNA polymerase-1
VSAEVHTDASAPVDLPADLPVGVPVGVPADLLADLRAAGVRRGSLLALVIAPGGGVGLASTGIERGIHTEQPAMVVRYIDAEIRPRWLWWNNETARALLEVGVAPSACWDLSAAHRLLFGGWQTDPARIWAALHHLTEQSLPGTGQLDLLEDSGDEGSDSEDPVRPDGHLRPEWVSGGWARSTSRIARWASAALNAGQLQQQRLASLRVRGDADATARSESAAELMCAELLLEGLPVHRQQAEQIIAGYIGPRPVDDEDARRIRARRDEAVREHVPGHAVDLRSPAQVRAMLERVGIEVPDTRSWRLETFRGAHPVVEALLTWRKAERFATTYGYDWLDRHVGRDGRLRGGWTGCDGGAGRMTAQAGLHSMPAELRPAVAAEAGHVLVRADLGQIEPRVLAAVSQDRTLAAATQADDLYAPVAARLNVERPIAKVAVLAAMYGQTSGAAGEALKGLESAYPVAMRYLRDAHEAGRSGRDVRTYGGRLVRMWPTPAGLSEQEERGNVASRGRYARNAVVQGAAAEFFKAWAVTVRVRGRAQGARVVLCLHDELLVHAPVEHGAEVAQLLSDCLQETATRWAPGGEVRFVADVSVIQRWSEAKG